MCVCQRFLPLVVRRRDIEARVRVTPRIRATLDRVAESAGQDAVLYRCRDCGEPWQSSRHASFGGAEYVFQVPEIAREAWISEPYLQPAALLAYAETKQSLAQTCATRKFGARPHAPTGRLFFLSVERLEEERARRRGSVAGHDAFADDRHAEHLEQERAVC